MQIVKKALIAEFGYFVTTIMKIDKFYFIKENFFVILKKDTSYNTEKSRHDK